MINDAMHRCIETEIEALNGASNINKYGIN